MTRNQRIGLIVAGLAVVVVAIVIAVSGGGGDDGGGAGATTQTGTTGTGTTATAETPTETVTETEAQPVAARIRIRGGEVAGGPADIQAKRGERVRIVVSSDAPDDIHLHGYDIEKKVEPGSPATFEFTADIEGIFEIESHVAEDAGRDPLVGKLTVEPS